MTNKKNLRLNFQNEKQNKSEKTRNTQKTTEHSAGAHIRTQQF